MNDLNEKALIAHKMWQGKIEMKSRVDLSIKDELAIAYTPGVASPCLEIEKDINNSYIYTRRWNTIAVITDGTSVLGLGDIGPEAGMPVMEGKALLFKTFGDVDAIPLCLKTKDVDEIVRTVYLLSGSFGGINLEDISAPRCFEIEEKLKKICDIPVFHDDQHGTAIVVGAALINALKVVKKDMKDIKCVINGAGAAGVSIGKFLMTLGVKNIIFCDKEGVIYDGKPNLNYVHQELAKISNKDKITGNLKEALVKADVFIGVSAPNVVTKEMVTSMAKDAICFPLANPVPEISYDDAKEAGAKIIGTGSSKFPNQINNVLVFPGLFRGVLDARASDINDEIMISAAYAIASMINDEDLNEHNIIPPATSKEIHKRVAEAVKIMAIKTKVSRI